MRQGLIPLLLLVVLAVGSDARAQEDRGNWNQDYDPHIAAIGLSAGFTSGTGLAVRWPALPQVMVSLAGGAWGDSDDLAWNVGLEAHYILRQAGRVRFFLGPAVAVYSDDENNVNASVGVGLEALLRPRLSFKVDLGFTYLSDDKSVYPLPQAAMFFYF